MMRGTRSQTSACTHTDTTRRSVVTVEIARLDLHFLAMRTPPPVLPPQDESVPRYKTTWLDGGGPDASIRLKAAVWGVMGFLVMLLIWGLVAKQQGLSGWKAFAVMVSGAAASGYTCTGCR